MTNPFPLHLIAVEGGRGGSKEVIGNVLVGRIVQKFGGSSLADVACIQRAAVIVADARAQGWDVVVVVSAMVGETDRLIALAKQVASECSSSILGAREMDALLATGEQASAALLSLALMERQCPSVSYGAAQVSIQTTGWHGQAAISQVETDKLQADLDAGRVPVIAGFQGVDQQGNLTTLGRGGSDWTAVAVAAALQADECQIYTDVAGIYTSDPRVVQDSRLMERITFDEMLELAAVGAVVLQREAVECARRHQVTLRVLSSFEEGSGTVVTVANDQQKTPSVSGVAFDRNQAKLTMVGLPNEDAILDQVMSTVRAAGIVVDIVIPVPSADERKLDVSFTVERAVYERAIELIQNFVQQFTVCQVLGDNKVAKLSIVGLSMNSHAREASRMLQVLTQEGIPIQLIMASENKISAVVHEKHLELGARILHGAFLPAQ